MGLRLRTEHRFLIDNNKTHRAPRLPSVPTPVEAPHLVDQRPLVSARTQPTIDANVPPPFTREWSRPIPVCAWQLRWRCYQRYP
ncbi:hypothetical protein STCU_11978 [Strigomonas culicis]|uniref:Uncharacterized protein n=1 Tax=Strigomonas culicis TaxID=28005 RepID=S9TGM4_9TRYP|nr:hypothetical protein STCU_11978 [Strigomonas culicis]|eukprot:EPY15498.1 hypothetical protein STCU_11978 [Strigomonas culicis]